MSAEIVRTQNFIQDAANHIIDRAHEAIASRGKFRIALSGGNTPRPVYRELARPKRGLSWENFVITFSDERCVPPEDRESNYRMAREEWFTPARVPASSVIRMAGEKPPALAASEYESWLRKGADQAGDPIYRHDLLLLGIGDDGHTASLFPETAALQETEHWVTSNFIAKFNAWRLTFTFPLINAAREVCFLVDGKSEDLIKKITSGAAVYPAAKVQPSAGRLTWIIGRQA